MVVRVGLGCVRLAPMGGAAGATPGRLALRCESLFTDYQGGNADDLPYGRPSSYPGNPTLHTGGGGTTPAQGLVARRVDPHTPPGGTLP